MFFTNIYSWNFALLVLSRSLATPSTDRMSRNSNLYKVSGGLLVGFEFAQYSIEFTGNLSYSTIPNFFVDILQVATLSQYWIRPSRFLVTRSTKYYSQSCACAQPTGIAMATLSLRIICAGCTSKLESTSYYNMSYGSKTTGIVQYYSRSYPTSLILRLKILWMADGFLRRSSASLASGLPSSTGFPCLYSSSVSSPAVLSNYSSDSEQSRFSLVS